MPVWGQPNEDRGVDISQKLSMPIGRPDFKFKLLAVGNHKGAEGIERRSPVVAQRLFSSLVVTFPDKEGGSRWYRFILYKPGA